MEDDTVFNELSRDLLQFNLDEINESSLEDPFDGNIQCASNSREQERIKLQPNTVLDRHLVSNQNRYKYIGFFLANFVVYCFIVLAQHRQTMLNKACIPVSIFQKRSYNETETFTITLQCMMLS